MGDDRRGARVGENDVNGRMLSAGDEMSIRGIERICGLIGPSIGPKDTRQTASPGLGRWGERERSREREKRENYGNRWEEFLGIAFTCPK